MNKIIPVIISIIFVGAGILMLFNSDKLNKRCTVETDAKIVGYKKIAKDRVDNFVGRENAEYTYYPIIEYKAKNELITKQYNMGSNTPQYKEGESIVVLYNPDKEDEFIIKGEKGLNIIGIVFTALGGIAFIATTVNMIRGKNA